MSIVNSIQVKKAIIPVAGLGTRMLPATKAIPKEMLPLVDKPLIQYVVSECVDAGINKIILITRSSKNSIENHFDTSFELEMMLEKRVQLQLLAEIQTILPPDVTIVQIRQRVIKGLGHAILSAYPLVGNNPIAVILPDIVIKNVCYANSNASNLSVMLKRFLKTGYSQILVKSIKDVTKYGIVDCQGKKLKQGDIFKITSIIEKPSLNQAPSNLSVVGRYVFSSNIWNILKCISSGFDDEIQLTDAISLLIKKEIVEAYHLIGSSYDCGNKLGYMQAFVEYGLSHKIFGKSFKSWLQILLSN